jgi:hypothetical protein
MPFYIHQVNNKSGQEIHLIALSSNYTVSYDLVLGPGEVVKYDKLLRAGGLPVPAAGDERTFEAQRIMVRVGAAWFSLFEDKARVRFVKGESYQANALPVNGRSDYPTIELVIGADGTFTAEIYSIVLGPDLACATWALSRTGLYGVGDINNLIQKTFIMGTWGAWGDLETPPHVALAGPLTAVCWNVGRYGMYAAGADGKLYSLLWLTSGWEPWGEFPSLPKGKAAGLAAASWISGRYGVYAVSSEGNLYERYWTTDHWVGWNDHQQPGNVRLKGPVTAVSYSGSRVAIYAYGSDGNVWQKWWAVSWSGWESIGAPSGLTIKSLSSASAVDRNYVVAAICSDNRLWVRRYKYGWYDWETYDTPPGVPLDGPLTIVASPTDPSYYFYVYYARGRDGAIYQYYGGGNPTWTMLDGR